MDALGRLYVTVTVSPGRLGLSLLEGDSVAGVFVGAYDATPGAMQAHRDRVLPGDRLVQLNDLDLLFLTRLEVIELLGQTADTPRQLTFLRAPSTAGRWDIAKKLLLTAPPGPLGLTLHPDITHWAVIEDATAPWSKTAHRGCRIVRINGVDVSTMERDAVVDHLRLAFDVPKTIELIRLAPRTCTRLLYVTPPVAFAAPTSMRLTATTSASNAVVIAVGSTDLTALAPAAAHELVRTASTSSRLLCYTAASMDSVATPSDDAITVTILDSSLGLTLESTECAYLKVMGFATLADADRAYYAPYKHRLPGACVAAVNGVDVSLASRDRVVRLLSQLPHVPRTVTFVTEAEIRRRRAVGPTQVVRVPAGPLGIDFDGNQPSHTVVAGFRELPNGERGTLERSGLVRAGSILVAINGFNISCLALHDTIALLQKLSHKAKDLTFTTLEHRPTLDVYVPAGPLGLTFAAHRPEIALLETISPNSVIQTHGAVAPQSVLVGVDGFDLSALSLAQVADLLKSLSAHAKVLSFTPPTANSSVPRRAAIDVVVGPGAAGVLFDPKAPIAAIVTGFTLGSCVEAGVPLGSRLEWIDALDVRSKSLADIEALLSDLEPGTKTLSFALTMPTAPLPLVHRDSVPSTIANLQETLSLTDGQVLALQRRLSSSSDGPPSPPSRRASASTADTVPPLPRKLSRAASTTAPNEEVQGADLVVPLVDFKRAYHVHKVVGGWFGKLKPRHFEFDRDQKYLVSYDNSSKERTYKHIPIASIASVTKGKSNVAKKGAETASDDQCLSVVIGKRTNDYICATVDDRDTFADSLETLIRARKL
ncbi:hypothetical protein SPRG_07361 [Saprolegnia parasitica CBS 223.65]|uniref:PDZ domain-containing protein n=1 Tax=Saprolegnia parasitica (strain CBS 223.65) TaxID=695850 RepID=A0A067CBB2_SAPPC|nr:hypothetical protein SPRG_07361 [Saprolegnia parasitica CBS 223.65]KDO27763.1 hypothetical protein SPRG_07361 [Saprolegnia parasitica CBS 223.65]|eukprot:XP_012201538.1 hypothetical protein SPRG_07361 [Saprolegnia parasitica CBS 223.65]